MSNLRLEEKRSKLRKEIKLAKQLLEYNINSTNPRDYLPSAKDFLPDMISNTISSASPLLIKLQPLLKNFLPREGKINSTLEILKIMTSDDKHQV